MDSNTTCSHVDDYSDTCLGSYDGGEDIIYELNVTELMDVDITLDPMGAMWTGIAIDHVCPPGDPCLAYSTSDVPDPHGIEALSLDPSVSYYIMVDSWPEPVCYDFMLTIEAPGYCDAWGGCDEYISNVDVADIHNLSGCEGYGNFTYLSTEMGIGLDYLILVENGNGYSDDYCHVWIDWNQDLDFEDTGEFVDMGGNPGPGPYTGMITPPMGAELGDTRMRVRIVRNAAPDPCGDTVFGEVEDYTVTVTSGP